jgi:hypothetical protein
MSFSHIKRNRKAKLKKKNGDHLKFKRREAFNKKKKALDLKINQLNK